ncbi:hypothetical protein ACQFX9_14050 [Aliinostoc sp. HNIBRCY26]|uniref:hypothetical protein n=1 Tax=Aliinostoc sp. HNIBRCY26 TaxID=3418997 RepID=UPI003CFD0680
MVNYFKEHRFSCQQKYSVCKILAIAALLKKENWLPKNFAQPNLDSSLAGEILYRSQERSLTV